MFLGHFGVALVAKQRAPRVSLGVLFASAIFLDLIWPLFLALGWERVLVVPGITVVTPFDFVSYPLSHSLLLVFVWAVVVGSLFKKVAPSQGGAGVVGVLVLSHWFLDLVVHRPDLPLLPMSDYKVGWGLWNSLSGSLVVELGLLALGTILYLRTTTKIDGVGRWALWGLVLTLVGIYLGGVFGPPPPSAEAVVVVGSSQWLFVLWAFWIDRHRVATAVG